MQITTTRFGAVAVKKSDILDFPEGILGFVKERRFVIVDDPSDEVFSWLQSADSPGIAFPIISPAVVYRNYKVNLNRAEKEVINAKSEDRLTLYLICTIPGDPNLMTANLKAPIVINLGTKMGKQIVAQENDYPIKFPIFNELRLRMLGITPTTPLKSHDLDRDIVVSLGDAPKENQRNLDI